MYDVLTDTFNYNLESYGVYVTVNKKTVKALFKTDKNIASSKSKEQYLTMFTAYTDNIEQGNEIVLNGKHYLAHKDNTDENTVYNKTYCIDCNQLIKYEVRHKNDEGSDLTDFYVNADNLSSSVDISDGITTLQSTCHFTFPLNDLSKRINLNDRFFAGQSKTGVWKIRDINYQNGFCEVYCIRDLINDFDDTENMIADRWKFEHRPDTYDILIDPAEFTISESETQQLSIAVKKNAVVIDPLPEITYFISNSEIVSIDPVTNIVTGLKEGTAIISGSYREASNDIVHSNSSKVTVTPNTVVGDIVVNPTYLSGNSYYSVKENYDPQTFTATLAGVSSPQWNIVLDPQGNKPINYTATINNSEGTFTVKNTQLSSKYLKFTINEMTTGKTFEYYVKLASMF
ncbi:MAG: hypothetical protein ACK5H4_12230 [Lacrimispora sphenoides]